MLSIHLPLVLLGLFLLQLRRYLSGSPPYPSASSIAIHGNVTLPIPISAISHPNPNRPGPPNPITAFDQPLRSSARSSRPQTELPVPFLPLPNTSHNDASPLSVPRTLLQSPILDHLLVSISSRFVFCPVPAVADSLVFEPLSAIFGPLLPLSAFAPRDRERLLLRTDVFRFAFVAHPFTRLLASYYRGTRSPGGLDSRTYRAFMARVRGVALANGQHEMQRISFQFFLTFLARQWPHELHEEFRSQSTICGFGSVNYDFVGRFERFERDIAFVHAKLGLTGTHVYVDNFMREASDKAPQLFRNTRFRSKAVKLYGDDLRNFDYSVY